MLLLFCTNTLCQQQHSSLSYGQIHHCLGLGRWAALLSFVAAAQKHFNSQGGSPIVNTHHAYLDGQYIPISQQCGSQSLTTSTSITVVFIMWMHFLLTSFLGPAQLSIASSTEKQQSLGTRLVFLFVLHFTILSGHLDHLGLLHAAVCRGRTSFSKDRALESHLHHTFYALHIGLRMS